MHHFKCIIAFGAALCLSISLTDATSHSSLRQVAVLSRHGVRGPYGLGTESPSEALINKYVQNPSINLPLHAVEWGTSENEDPAEIVSPKLTKHGYNIVERMGEYFRNHLYREFINNMQCSQAFAYADANQRDNLTAEAFFSGSYPSCKNVVPITASTRLLFEQGQDPTTTCPVCSQTVYEGITGAKDCRNLVHENREDIAALNSILQCCTPQACALDDAIGLNPNGNCTFFDIPSHWNGAFYDPWKDTLSSADYFTEFLLLMAMNNMTIPPPFTIEQILSLSSVHEAHMDLVTNEVNSANFGATLLAHITASFEQTVTGTRISIPSGEGPSLAQSLDNQFLYYAGHDINILYVRNLLRLQWYTNGWHPHEPTPGGMLVFELHSSKPTSSSSTTVTEISSRRGSDQATSRRLSEAVNETNEEYYIKLFFVTASPEQMRKAEILSDTNPPDVVPVMIPLCSEDVQLSDGSIDVLCSFKTFKRLIGRTLKHACVADTLRPFVDDLVNNGTIPSSDSHGHFWSLSNLLWVLMAIVVGVFVTIVTRSTIRARSGHSSVYKPEYGTLPQVVSE